MWWKALLLTSENHVPNKESNLSVLMFRYFLELYAWPCNKILRRKSIIITVKIALKRERSLGKLSPLPNCHRFSIRSVHMSFTQLRNFANALI